MLDLLDVLALAEVDRERDDVQVVLFPDPGHHDRGVESAAVGQNDLVACHGRSSSDGRKTKKAPPQPPWERFPLDWQKQGGDRLQKPLLLTV